MTLSDMGHRCAVKVVGKFGAAQDGRLADRGSCGRGRGRERVRGRAAGGGRRAAGRSPLGGFGTDSPPRPPLALRARPSRARWPTCAGNSPSPTWSVPGHPTARSSWRVLPFSQLWLAFPAVGRRISCAATRRRSWSCRDRGTRGARRRSRNASPTTRKRRRRS